MAGDAPPGASSDADFYRLIRARLEHEDSLIVNRLSWLMASQSFLFTAYAIVLNGLATPAATASVQDHQHRLIRLIPLVGIASAVLIYVGIVAAARAMTWLGRLFRARRLDEANLGLPPIRTPASMLVPGLAAPLVLPAVFAAIWLYVLLVRVP